MTRIGDLWKEEHVKKIETILLALINDNIKHDKFTMAWFDNIIDALDKMKDMILYENETPDVFDCMKIVSDFTMGICSTISIPDKDDAVKVLVGALTIVLQSGDDKIDFTPELKKDLEDKRKAPDNFEPYTDQRDKEILNVLDDHFIHYMDYRDKEMERRKGDGNVPVA